MKKTLAKKNLGQNSLISDLAIDQNIKYLSIEDNQNIIEIGPGRKIDRSKKYKIKTNSN